MSRAFSIYLDLIRFLAASLVMLYHANWIFRPGLTITSLGHEAVVVFFVLSGFVIAYVTDTREQDFRDFMVARGARIFSVAIPAIILTAVLDASGFWLTPDAYPVDYRAWDLPLIRVITSALFLNEIWTLGIQLFTNVPYWSLNYEVWYYVLFGVLYFFRGWQRTVAFIGLCLFLGPKILLLLPVWWMGVWVYRSERLRNLSLAKAWICVVLSLIGGYYYLALNLGQFGWDWVQVTFGVELHRELSFSRQFITDYYLGAVLALHFVGMRVVLADKNDAPAAVEGPIRYFAGSTFSIYLYHQPLLWFYLATFSWIGEGVGRYFLILVLTLGSCLLLSVFTEQRKDIWKAWIEKLLAIGDGLYGRLRGARA